MESFTLGLMRGDGAPLYRQLCRLYTSNVQMANITKLSGDIDGGESMLFLVDDMEYFQEQYMLFAYNDGTSPAAMCIRDRRKRVGSIDK